MPAEPLDLATPLRIHIIGAGGAGMSGLARLLSGLGHTVSGSDLAHSPSAAALAGLGITVAIGHDAANVGDAQVVVASPAVPDGNAELVAAASRGIRVASRAEVLAAVGRLRATLAVAGTHGKTTTSSMLTLILATAGHDPSWLVGADVSGLGANARISTGPELVLEADESYGAFAQLAPALVAINNVEPDHLDFYGDVDGLRRAFAGLLERSDSQLVNADDPVAADLGAHFGAATVGATAGSDFLVTQIGLERSSSSFRLEHPGGRLLARVGAPGRHNVANASLAAAVALIRGVSDSDVVEALGRFAGVPRRFEFRGEALGATIVDDYAHLPTEVAVTVATARSGGWRRVVAVFQPHRYTRTQALAPQFAGAFDGADVVVVTDIYASGEAPIPGVSGRLVADAIAGAVGAPKVIYVKDRADLARAVAGIVEVGDLVLTMGAGDLTTLPDELIGLRA